MTWVGLSFVAVVVIVILLYLWKEVLPRFTNKIRTEFEPKEETWIFDQETARWGKVEKIKRVDENRLIVRYSWGGEIFPKDVWEWQLQKISRFGEPVLRYVVLDPKLKQDSKMPYHELVGNIQNLMMEKWKQSEEKSAFYKRETQDLNENLNTKVDLNVEALQKIARQKPENFGQFNQQSPVKQ